MNFGAYIKKARETNKISKSELARRIGVTPQYMADIERGHVLPSEEKIEKLVAILEIDERTAFKLADKLPLRIIKEMKKTYYKE